MKAARFVKFSLEKLYLDCIDDRGNCFIIYMARLQIFFVRMSYSSLIFSDSAGLATGKSYLMKSGKDESADQLILANNILQIEGQWKRIDNPIPVFIYSDNNDHKLEWYCHHPKALAEIKFKGSLFRGFGYAETLSLTIQPFELPMEELRWGRFLSDRYTIIWINWKGVHPVNKLFCNGLEYTDSIFEEERIIFAGGTYILYFNEIFVIRKGKLANLFSRMPWMKIFFSNSILNTNENKYKAKSILSRNQEISSSGWALYEIVIWKK
jgi:hypothetical protein